MKLRFRFLLVSLYLVVWKPVGGLAIQGLKRNFGLGCVENGTTVNYTCTVIDNGPVLLTTVWEGTAFGCPPTNDIILQHVRYSTTGDSGTCRNGVFNAESVSVVENEYTSRLDVMTRLNLNDSTIRCAIAGQLLVGSDTIIVGVIPPAPGSAVIILFNSGPPSSLTVSWSPPSSPVVGGIAGYIFGVTGDCGDCMNRTVSADTLNVTCSGWTANDQACTVEVRTLTQDCGFTSDAATNSVTLSVPSSPIDVSVQPKYGVNGSVIFVDVEFTGVVAPMLGTGLMSDISYTVTFAGSSTPLQFTVMTCNLTNYCTLRVQGSELSPSDTYTVSVVASNVVGSGSAAVFPSTVPSNLISGGIVRVVVNVSTATVSCNLLSSYTDTPNAVHVCTISYGPSPNCDMFMDSSTPTTGRSGDTLIISLSQTLDPQSEYCYIVTLNNGDLLMNIVGIFRSACDPGALGGGGDPSSFDGQGMVTVLNGVINYSGVLPGSTAQLVCNEGYTPEEDSSGRVCLSDGNWSGGNQICVFVPDSTTLSYGATIAVSVTMTFILTLVLGIFIGVVSVLLYNKCRRGTGQSSSQPPTEMKQVGPVYEEPEDFKPDPHTVGNVAYGHIQPLYSRQ